MWRHVVLDEKVEGSIWCERKWCVVNFVDYVGKTVRESAT